MVKYLVIPSFGSFIAMSLIPLVGEWLDGITTIDGEAVTKPRNLYELKRPPSIRH